MIFNSHKNNPTRGTGFTLVETLVAIFILTFAIAGPLTIASRELGAALIAKDQTTAFYLAQDAMEHIRAVRDSNKLAGAADWLNGMSSTCGKGSSPYGCTTDTSLGGFAACPGSGTTPQCPPLYYYPSSAAYSQVGNPGTVRTTFVRQVYITPIAAGEARVTVTMSWTDVAHVLHTLVVQENIYDWQ